jgi:hypothetical protein
MNSGFGGAQLVMQGSVVFKTDDCLGPCADNSILSVCVAQSMVFLPTNVGPFWIFVAEQNESVSDRLKPNAVPPKQWNKTKKDLAVKLSVPGDVLDPLKFKLKKWQEMASAQAIPLQKMIPSIKQGWAGMQKGLLQVPWEQGCINAAASLEERAIVKKDDTGTADEEFSLQRILEPCLDFANEATKL